MVIGVLAAAVVAGGGYGIYQAVQSDPAPIPETTIEDTTTEAIITTQAESTTEEEIAEAPTDAPTEATTADTTTKATTTTQKAVSAIELSQYINSDGRPTVTGAELAKILGYGAAVDESATVGQYVYYSGANKTGGRIIAHDQDRISRFELTKSGFSLYGLRVGDPMPGLDALAAHGYAGNKGANGAVWFWKGNDDGFSRVIYARTK